MLIYKATNLINNKSYIGQTIHSLESRKSGHLESVKNKSKCAFHRAIRKYGEVNFKWEVIYECNSIDELNEKEQHYIKEYNTFTGNNNSNGYNMTTGGLNYIRRSEDNPMLGISRLQRMVNKYGEELGKIKYDEWKEKTYKTLSKQNSGKGNAMYGKNPYDYMVLKYGVDEAKLKWDDVHKKTADALRGRKQPKALIEKMRKTRIGQDSNFQSYRPDKQTGKLIKFNGKNCNFIKKIGWVIEDEELFIDLYYNKLYSIPMMMNHFLVTRGIIDKSFNYYKLTPRTMSEEVGISNKRRAGKIV